MAVMGGSSNPTRQPGAGEVARRLADICGTRFTRPAGAADDVAGAPARWVAAPGSVHAAAEVLRLAAEHGLSVVPRGAGTKIDWGATPSRLDIVLDTGRLAGIRHEPAGAPVVEAGAGTPLRAVQAVLERAGQRLLLDAPSSDATIGGVLAADEPGPLRHRHGTPADQLVGASYLDARGELTRAGGDQAGELDAARLLCGSQGALGVLVSVTVRVQPIPASRVWVSRSVWTPLEMHDLVHAVVGASVNPAAIEVDLPVAGPGPRWSPRRAGPAGIGAVAVLIEGGPADVAERATRLVDLLRGDATATHRAPDWWRRYPFGSADVALRIDVPITDLYAAVYALRDATGGPVPVRGSAGLGTVHAALAGTTPPDRVAAILTAVRGVLLARRGRCVVVAAPAPIRRAVDLWGELSESPRLRAVKQRVDPHRRLAPGRLPGGH